MNSIEQPEKPKEDLIQNTQGKLHSNDSENDEGYELAVFNRIQRIIAANKGRGRSSAAHELHVEGSDDDQLSRDDIENVAGLLADNGIRFEFYEKSGVNKVQFDW